MIIQGIILLLQCLVFRYCNINFFAVSVDQDTVPTTHPKCRAVIEARWKLQQWLNPDESEVSLGSVKHHAKPVT